MTDVSRPGSERISRRRILASSERANMRALPTWPWAARAAWAARAGETPSRVISSSVTASSPGVTSLMTLHRERMVMMTSSALGAQRSHTVLRAGSSRPLRSASAPRSVIRSASSTTTIWCRFFTGAIPARPTSARTSSTPIESCSVRSSVTSG